MSNEQTAPTKAPRDEFDQPLPNGDPNSPNMQDLVIADIEQRLKVGISRYGQGLKCKNGRNMLRDAYEEAIDLAIYLRGCLYEQDGY